MISLLFLAYSTTLSSPLLRRPKFLWISPHLPWPLNNGSKIRFYHLLTNTQQWADIDLFVPFSPKDAEHADLVRNWVRSLHFEEFTPLPKPGPASRLLSPFATNFQGMNHPAMQEAIHHQIQEGNTDLVECHHTRSALLAPFHTVPHAVHFVDWAWRVESSVPEGASPKRRIMAKWDGIRARWLENRCARKADLCFFMSEEDRSLCPIDGARGHQERLVVLPNGVDLAARPFTPCSSGGLLFMGTLNYAPNREALLWWHQYIRPLVDQTLTVIGSSPPPDLVDMLAQGAYQLHQNVPDTLPFLQSHKILVVPLLSGSGTRLKILEAFASGLAVVSTPQGAEGLGASDGQHLLLAKSPQEFAQAIHRLQEDPFLFQALTKAARKLVEARYDWSRLAQIHQESIEKLLKTSKGG